MSRTHSDVSGALLNYVQGLPFGDSQTVANPDWSVLHFIGQPWDSESNLTHFWFRQYSPTQGRWMMPDPAGLAAVNPGDPQSWNRYSYVVNDPANRTDELGLDNDCGGPCTPFFISNGTCPILVTWGR